ncbi:4Fe-4S binding protein [Dyadobacter arcticus]|uniref:Formate hydrogenlyase subunit 6/NADH:ubiquinone oxidoreductase subunit I n=1 Tax=Dyadobacter arcticus TaxID=1078754 RepID=A0ABX0URQ0_9BACT|nr:4Fe-4S binding protein [Dyadobacter arcticus]NIJ55654.1 formate hydrogenlyase subunit 6/NADH:ubiquinone oxidoreductase subunit I [Dyadobacter arcticus]
MKLTLSHFWSSRHRRKSSDIRSGNFYDQGEGMVTVQYPRETIPIPDNGRYRLHNEMDDCIVCDKCVKVCPVDCIEIEPIRAIEEVGRASDGSPIRLYAAKFDIDMAKCCYCGLCTTVCPTECLTMTKTFDYSELDVRDMVYNYANLTPEEADEKRRLLDQFQKEKEASKIAAKPATVPLSESATPAARPVFKPTIKPKPQEIEAKVEIIEDKEDVEKPAAKPVFRPTIKPKTTTQPVDEKPVSEVESPPVPPKPVFRPTIKPKPPKE